MKDILNKYQVRFYKRQKTAFKHALFEKMSILGYQSETLSKKIKMVQVEDLLVGNFKQAKTIMVVPYDTPAKIYWFKHAYYPMNGDVQMRKSFFPIYGPLLVSYAVLLLIIYVLPNYLRFEGSQLVLSLVSTIYLALLLLMIVKGFANHKNAIRNSASIQLAYDIAANLDERKRKEVAFVFTDKNTTKVKGSYLFEGYMNQIKKGTEKIVLYCIGGGETIQIGYKKGLRKVANDLQKKYKGEYALQVKGLSDGDCMQTPMEPLSNALLISSGELQDQTLFVKNTASSKDREYDERLVLTVQEMLVNYIKNK